MLPSARVVLEDPLLDAVPFNSESRGLVAAADKLAVDLPLAIATLEPESARDARRVVGVREPVKIGASRDSRRVDAVVGYNRTIDDDLEDLVALASADDVAVGTTPIVLLQPVLNKERFACIVREIDDHVYAFGD